MNVSNLKSAHRTRTIKVEIFADGQTPSRIPLSISDGAHSMVLHFKPEEITERGPEVASILDSAFDCYIARQKTSAGTESPDASAGGPFLVGLSPVPDAPRQPRTASARGKSYRPAD